MWTLIDMICRIFGLSEHESHGCLQFFVALAIFALAFGAGVGLGMAL